MCALTADSQSIWPNPETMRLCVALLGIGPRALISRNFRAAVSRSADRLTRPAELEQISSFRAEWHHPAHHSFSKSQQILDISAAWIRRALMLPISCESYPPPDGRVG
jgi:hypothetical protein